MSTLKNSTKKPNPAMTDALKGEKKKKKSHGWPNNIAYAANRRPSRAGYHYSNYYTSSAKPQPNCPTCGDLNQTLWASNTHIISIPELKTTAPSCLACKAVLGLVEQKGETWRITDDHKVLFYALDNRLQVVVSKCDDSETGGNIELYRRGKKIPHQEQQSVWPAVGFGRRLSPALSASEAAEMITSWLQQCRSSHSFRNKEADDAALPSRVIAVGSEESRREPYLHETREGETGKTSIPLSQLPRTFADAILVCRALGIPYIWIDSLCIIQDDKEDWAREATRMADVYRNAVLTLSADGASTAPDDYLYARIFDRKRIDFDAADTRTGVHTSFTSESRNRTEPLNSRAWCYQEWILSRRVVHFATGEILWDCLHAEGCECQLHFCLRVAPKGIRTRQAVDPFSTMGILASNPWTVWDQLVSDFTARVMTFNTDKLPAFSGIAGYYAKERPGDTYVAGHWLSELPTSLL
ncbi:heterokaryon incompatibility protein-domain-containing protein [Rhypophila decipiens]|uniref:Heterokaryon incompatibility protein-domain-containing protein n=1 Tax=Rhypophila decipiens TaxID=261697 RepID=A0AAN6XTM7_9PEZI|nr:heterokaryon incompatibility protein-domain-containing protein [Rhypophila decipiens]